MRIRYGVCPRCGRRVLLWCAGEDAHYVPLGMVECVCGQRYTDDWPEEWEDDPEDWSEDDPGYWVDDPGDWVDDSYKYWYEGWYND